MIGRGPSAARAGGVPSASACWWASAGLVHARGPGRCGRVSRRRGGCAPSAGRACWRRRAALFAAAALTVLEQPLNEAHISGFPDRPSARRDRRRDRRRAAARRARRHRCARDRTTTRPAGPPTELDAAVAVADARASADLDDRRSSRRHPPRRAGALADSATSGGKRRASRWRSRCSSSLRSSRSRASEPPLSRGLVTMAGRSAILTEASGASTPTCWAAPSGSWPRTTRRFARKHRLLAAGRPARPHPGRRSRRGAVQRDPVRLLPHLARAADRRQPLRDRSQPGFGDAVRLVAPAGHRIVARGRGCLRRDRS